MRTAKFGIFYASLDRNPGREALHSWLAKAYGLLDVLVEVREGAAQDDVEASPPPHGDPPLFARIERRNVGGDSFPFDLVVSGPWVEDPWRELSALCRHFRCRALGDDESVNPYSRMLMDENGESWWVDLDVDALDDPVEEREVIRGPCGEPEGWLLTTAPVDEPLVRGVLAEVLAVAPEHLQTDAVSGDLDPFDRVGFGNRYPIVRGQHFRHRVMVTVSRAQRSWVPVHHALRTWINQMTLVAQRLQTKVCITHRALHFVRNAHGDKDYEHRCYYWDGEGLQNFVYKKTRTEWKK